MKRHILYLLATLLCLTACSDDPFGGNNGYADGDTPFEGGVVTLTLSLPDYEQTNVSRSVSDDAQDGVFYAVVYASDGTTCLDVIKLSTATTEGDNTISKNNDGTYTATIELPKNSYYVDLVANAASGSGNTLSKDLTKENCAGGLQAITNSADLNSTATTVKPICWGYATIADLLGVNPSITLVRQCAKISVTSKSDNFTIEGVKYVSGASVGTIALEHGKSWLTDALPSTDEKYEYSMTDYATSPVYAYDATAGKSYLLIKAKYTDANKKITEGYYRVDLKSSNTTTDYLPILRNHEYSVTISYAMSAGYTSEDEAKESNENRITYNVYDSQPAIVDMIACKDYYLGVSAPLTFDCNNSNKNASIVVANNENNKTTYAPSIKIADNTDNWLTATLSDTKTTVPSGTQIADSKQSGGVLYTLNVTAAANAGINPRTATITVTAGDLERTITVTQEGFDFLAADNRRVSLYNSGTSQETSTLITANYFAFANATNDGNGALAYGTNFTDKNSNVRSHCLQLGFGSTAYSYRVPYLDGDKLGESIDSKISVTLDETNKYYVVKPASTAEDKTLWNTSFTITNKEGVEITYPVYHSGIFHHITSTTYQPSTETTTGWFYYEVVKVKGTSGTEYYILDRNLGAQTNQFYNPSASDYAANTTARGAYYKITETAAQSLEKSIAPTGFAIPTNNLFVDLPILRDMGTTSVGDAYYLYSLATESESMLETIYFPMAGYYEDDTFKNTYHAQLWTKSILSGAQGYTSGMPEYGYWFFYLDMYNKQKTTNQLRFVSGANGNNTGRYRYMPIRCTYGDGSAPAPVEKTYKYTYTIYYLVKSTSVERNCIYTYNSEIFGEWSGLNVLNGKSGAAGTPTIDGFESVSYYKASEGYVCVIKGTLTDGIPPQNYVLSKDGGDTYKLNNKTFTWTSTQTTSGNTITTNYVTYIDCDANNLNAAPTKTGEYTPTEKFTDYTPVLENANEVSFFLLTDKDLASNVGCYHWTYGGEMVWDDTKDNMVCKGYYTWNNTKYKIWKVIFNKGPYEKLIFRIGNYQSTDYNSATNHGIYYYDGKWKTNVTYTNITVSTVASSNSLSSNAISRSASGTVKIGSAYWQQQAQKSKWYSIGK